MSNSENSFEGLSVQELIERIQQGSLNPKLVPKEDRQRCVVHLLDQGGNYESVAAALGVSSKTIARDVAEIRKRNSIGPSKDLALELVGELIHSARVHRAFLQRMARVQLTTNPARIQAEYFAWRILYELVDKLQSVGWMPKQTEKISAELVLSDGDDSEEWADIALQVEEMEQLAKKKGGLSPEGQKKLAAIKSKLTDFQSIRDAKKTVNECRESLDSSQEENHDSEKY